MGSQAGFRGFIYLNPRTGDAVIANFNTRNDAHPEDSMRGLLAVRDAALDLIGDKRP
jgi:hypothetical protein